MVENLSTERPAMLVTVLFTAAIILTAMVRKWREVKSMTTVPVVETLSISAATSVGQATQDSTMATPQ